MANTLAEQLEKAKNIKPTGRPPKIEPPTESLPATQPTAKKERQANRKEKKGISLWVDAIVLKQLKQLALDRDTTQTELLTEALNDLFTKYGKPPIA